MGALNILEPSAPVQTCNGIALTLYSVFKNKCLSANFKLTLQEALFSSVRTYLYHHHHNHHLPPFLNITGNAGRHPSFKLAILQNKMLCTTGSSQGAHPTTK
jgi:hypothetical protein